MKELKPMKKEGQFCDNPECECYNKIGAWNVRIKSTKERYFYCNKCKRSWKETKGTFFANLQTPAADVLKTLMLLVEGMGLNATHRVSGFTKDAILDWIRKASKHSQEINKFFIKDMHFSQVQIDEFWSFIFKKTNEWTRKKIQKNMEITGDL
jgi:transposase-like protein